MWYVPVSSLLSCNGDTNHATREVPSYCITSTMQRRPQTVKSYQYFYWLSLQQVGAPGLFKGANLFYPMRTNQSNVSPWIQWTHAGRRGTRRVLCEINVNVENMSGIICKRKSFFKKIPAHMVFALKCYFLSFNNFALRSWSKETSVL